MQMRQPTLSKHESKPKLGYHASQLPYAVRGAVFPLGAASTAPRPNATNGDESGIYSSAIYSPVAVF